MTPILLKIKPKYKMRSKLYIVGLIFLLIFQSCDCWVIIDGNIIDSKTGNPLINAQLEFLNIKSTNNKYINDSIQISNTFKTDSLGHFDMISDNYGICPNINPIIKIQKDGYKTKKYIVENNRKSITIKLEKK